MRRHQAMVAIYTTELATLLATLDTLDAVRDAQKREAMYGKAVEHLKTKQKRRKHQPFDPSHLSNLPAPSNPNRKPKTTREQFSRLGFFSNPSLKVAVHGSFDFSQLPSAQEPAYLAETDEIVLTQAIRDKAAELHHNPVQIYNWVRNHIAWIPTWGAIQNAEQTLQAKRGNAMDISSLLIALLRASDIPARYVHGTIEVPADAFQNWAGDVARVDLAANAAASAGIPLTSLVSGGNIVAIRMEHIWVEAAIDFLLSRGARNRVADTWVGLDPSFKQYDDQEGIDVLHISGIDVGQLAQDFGASNCSCGICGNPRVIRAATGNGCIVKYKWS